MNWAKWIRETPEAQKLWSSYNLEQRAAVRSMLVIIFGTGEAPK